MCRAQVAIVNPGEEGSRPTAPAGPNPGRKTRVPSQTRTRRPRNRPTVALPLARCHYFSRNLAKIKNRHGLLTGTSAPRCHTAAVAPSDYAIVADESRRGCRPHHRTLRTLRHHEWSPRGGGPEPNSRDFWLGNFLVDSGHGDRRGRGTRSLGCVVLVLLIATAPGSPEPQWRRSDRGCKCLVLSTFR